MLGASVHSEASIDAALVLCTLHNGSVLATQTNGTRTTSGAQVCSNSFPGLMLAPKKFDLNMVLQVSRECFEFMSTIRRWTTDFVCLVREQ